MNRAARVLALSALVPCSASWAATLLVPQQYPTIRDALWASQSGDTVLVAPGVYPILQSSDFNGALQKRITLQGAGVGLSVLTVPESVSVYLQGPPLGAPLVFAGFSIRSDTPGQSAGQFSLEGNGEVRACAFESMQSAKFRAMGGTPTLVKDCTFVGNWDWEPAQVFASTGNPVTVDGCTFTITSNGGPSNPSALLVNNDSTEPDAAVVRDSHFACNTGGSWGALAGHPSRIESCVFSGNVSEGVGGAIMLLGVGGGLIGATVIADCHFFGNSASFGGAVCVWAVTLADIQNCEFANNSADYAGAIYSAGPVLVNDTTFCGNTGGDILAGGTYGSGNTFDADCGEDCDEDGVPDASAIALGLVEDLDGDGVPDVCQPQYFSGDLNGDCVVNGADLGVVIAGWGSNTGAGDVNQDGSVDGSDLAVVLGQWSG